MAYSDRELLARLIQCEAGGALTALSGVIWLLWRRRRRA